MVSPTIVLACLVLLGLSTSSVAKPKEDVVMDFSSRSSPTINKRLCESCFYHPQCNSGVCHKRKCVASLSKVAIATCNRPECSRCDSRLVCRSNKCWGPPGQEKCVKNSIPSKEKCFPGLFASPGAEPPMLGEECESCVQDGDCESKICDKGKCTLGTIDSFKKCFGRPFCSKCTRSIQCKTKICYSGRCTGRTQKSKFRCFGRPDCEPCNKDRQCASDHCATVGGVGKCARKGHESKCFNK